MTLHIDAAEVTDLAHAWRQAPELVAREMTAATTEAQLLLLREVKERTPTGATSALRESIHADAPLRESERIMGIVGTSIAHAVPVELGTRPHFPPIAPLVDWVRAKLGITDDDEATGVAFSIARKIALRGTLAIGMFHRGLTARESDIQRIYAAATQRIATGLTDG